MTRARKILLGCMVVLLGVSGWFVQRAISEHRIVAARVPARPGIATWPAEFQARVTEADAAARGYLRPVAALTELSQLYHANGFFEEALIAYEALQRVEPHNPRWPHLSAGILAGNGQLDRALPLFQRAVALAPAYLPARLRLGDTLLKSNQTSEASRVYSAILAQHTDEPYALLGLARSAVAANDWDKARDYARRSLAAHPDFLGGLIFAEAVHEHFGEVKEAAAVRARNRMREHTDVTDPWADAILEHCYDAYRLSVAAAVALARGDVTTAERWLLRAIQYSAKPAPFHRQLGKLYVAAKNDQAARQHFQEATRLEPTDSDAWAFLVNLLNTTGDRAGAYRAVIAGLASCPDSRALHYAYGHMLTKDGRFPQAMVELRAAKRLQPNEANAYIDLALIHFQLDQVEHGVAEMRGALKVQPDHPLALTLLTRHAIDFGDARDAAALFRRMRAQTRIAPRDIEDLAAAYRGRFGQPPP
jgi:tetratricopeptide (TPR) repeat protein